MANQSDLNRRERAPFCDKVLRSLELSIENNFRTMMVEAVMALLVLAIILLGSLYFT